MVFYGDSMKCQKLKCSQWLNLARLTYYRIGDLRDATSHQWMEEIFMHKNVDFPSSISIMNGVRLITADTAIFYIRLPRRNVDDSHHFALCHESHLSVPDVISSKRKIGCVQKTR